MPTGHDGVWFELTCSDGQQWKGGHVNDVWSEVLAALQETRCRLDLPYVPISSSNGEKQFGVDVSLVMRLLEQLPDADKCGRHSFLYYHHKTSSSWRTARTVFNVTGCARSEPFNGKHSAPDMFSFLTSDLRPDPPVIDQGALEAAILHAETQGSNARQSQSDLPVAMRYRKCQRTYKQKVGVYQSHIHGLGLYCLQEIEAGDMVIEYAGTVIRSILTDKREKYYDSKGIECYMFRIDNDDVVDATMSGNMARFINHKCEV